MKKVLFVASVSGHILAFHIPYLKYFKEEGYEVEVAARDKEEIPFCDLFHEFSIRRNPFEIDNIKAYAQLKRIIKDGNYDIIHCHTPVASIFTRLAARNERKKGTKVIYTAHGFHFFKGAPILNWLIYFPIEWISSFFTDVLITMNQEDYSRAKKYFHAQNTYYVDGVGIDTKKYNGICFKTKEELFNVDKDDIVLLSVGELSKRKNHEVVLKAIAKLNNKNIHYFIAGKGKFDKYLLDLAKELGISDNFHLLGFRNDIEILLGGVDVFCFPSLQEGLPVSLMEAMAMGKPCIASRVRGNVDLIEDGNGGFLCNPSDADEFAQKIERLIRDKELCKRFGEENMKKIKEFDIQKVKEEMKNIYQSL